MDMLDSNDPLVVLADTIQWSKFENEFAKFYSKNGRPAKPIRLMVGLLLLKQLENLSDENVVLQWKRNPYFQYFCGYSDFQTALPCHRPPLHKGTKCDMRFKSSLNSARLNLLNPYK